MLETFRILFAEQTTPDEVIIFLVISVLLALLVAFALYAAVLAALWRGRLREVTTLGALLFPTRQQVSRYLGEYVLAGATSALLTLTIAARHDAVQHVLDYPLYQVEASEIRQAFPFGTVEVEEMVGPAELPSELASSLASLVAGGTAGEATGLRSIGVEALLLPTIAAGGADNAALWLRPLVDGLQDDPWRRFPTERHLLSVALALLFGYVLWFAFGRTRAVAEAGEAAETDYARIAGRLLVPAACVALLLLSAGGVGDAQRLTRSAVAAAGLGLDAEGADAARYLGTAMSHQRRRTQLLRYLVAGSDSVPGPLDAIEWLDEQVREVRGVTEELVRGDAATELRLGALLREIEGLSTRMARDSAYAEGARERLGVRTGAIEADLPPLRAQTERSASQSEEALRAARGGLQAVSTLESRLGIAEGSLGRLEASVRQLASELSSSGLLLVVVSPPLAYQVRAGGVQGTVQASGTGIGLHALPPGAYGVTSDIGSATRRLGVGEAETVRLERQLGGPAETFPGPTMP